jgi:hypothetical protein
VKKENQDVEYVIKAFTTTPQHIYKIQLSIVSLNNPKLKSDYKTTITIGKTPIQTKFVTSSRLVSKSRGYFKVELDAWDDDVGMDSMKRLGLSFSWSCTNLGANSACKYTDQSLVVFDATNSFYLNTTHLVTNTTYGFFCTVAKDDRRTLVR